MEVKFVETKKYKYCCDCMKEIKDETDFFDGECLWHKKCHDEFIFKMGSLTGYNFVR